MLLIISQRFSLAMLKKEVVSHCLTSPAASPSREDDPPPVFLLFLAVAAALSCFSPSVENALRALAWATHIMALIEALSFNASSKWAKPDSTTSVFIGACRRDSICEQSLSMLQARECVAAM